VVIAVPSPGNQRPVEGLRDLGLRVVVVDAHSVAELEAAIVTIGETVGRPVEARALVARIEAQFDAVRARVAPAPPRRVLLLVGHSPLIAAGAGTVQDELIRRAGGVNVAASAGRGWPHLSIEFAIAAAPEVIIDTGMESAGGSDTFWRAFPSLPAVRDGRVSGFAGDALLRPGPRIGEAVETLARRIHPERFDHAAGSPTAGVDVVESTPFETPPQKGGSSRSNRHRLEAGATGGTGFQPVGFIGPPHTASRVGFSGRTDLYLIPRSIFPFVLRRPVLLGPSRSTTRSLSTRSPAARVP